MRKKLIVILILAISACGPVKLLVPSQTDADRGAQKFPGYTLNELNEGKSIYESHCNKCHRYKAPETRDETKWDHVIPIMARRAKLDSTQQSQVLKYVVTMSTAKAK